jgi:hypothetical protein
MLIILKKKADFIKGIYMHGEACVREMYDSTELFQRREKTGTYLSGRKLFTCSEDG